MVLQVLLCIGPAFLDKGLKKSREMNSSTSNLLGGPFEWLRQNEDLDYPPPDYETFKRPAKAGKPVNVWTYIRLDHLYEISEDSSTIKFHLTVRLKWNDTRLRFTPSGPSREARSRIVKPESIWHPSLMVLKERTHRDPLETVRVANTGEVTYTAHYDSEVWAEIDFRHYPFDSHKFVVDVSSYRYSADRVILNMTNFDPNRVNLEALSGPQWRVVAFNQKSVPNKRTVYLDNDSVVEIELFVKRRATNPLVVMILPMSLLGILSTLPLFLSVEKFSDRASIAATGCFTIVMFFFVVNEYFPKMGYLTWLHYYTIFTNVYIFGAFFAIMGLQVMHKAEGGMTDLGWKERWNLGPAGDRKSRKANGISAGRTLENGVKGPSEDEEKDFFDGTVSSFKALQHPQMKSYPQLLNDKLAYGFLFGYVFFNVIMFASEYENW
eukprot:CAMPEP_0184490106 /NCGR_PEP_ID=MMETSP0113_2-20130426/17182_1 /TAXON_ID=91329 /ORGANISM="Norrisiella sphaerica, Strain BC52" /LENGTH=436 /DNA_ID=CAMNT_0026873863 /DNA_START=233 /DNA_END=1540 /DNA_ORIENTATION=-